MLLGLALLLPATAQAAPAYLRGLFEREPYKPLGHHYSSSPDREECEALKKKWDDYWNELQARHQPCLDAHQGEPMASSNEGHGCSYAACAPYHNVGSQDVGARTAIKDCFAAAKAVEEAEEKRIRDLEEDEKQKDKAIKEATERHRADLEAREKEQVAQEKKEVLKQEKEAREKEKKRKEEERNKEKHAYSESLRDKADKRHEKAKQQDMKDYHQDLQAYERDAQKLEQQAESASKTKESLFKGAREVIAAVKLPPVVNKKAIFAVGKMASGQTEEGLVDLSGAVGNTSLSTGTMWAPYQIPFRFVGDISRTTLQVSDSLGRALSAQDIDRDWPALEAELDAAPQQYIKNVYSFENLMKHTDAKNKVMNPVQKFAGKAALSMLPKTWQNPVKTLSPLAPYLIKMVNKDGDKLYENVFNSWMNPE